ncbi:MAG: hypoxanthine phosphoribosyltransferase [candidate division WS1 bacterium]|nr:hypoxanthine phosphoribosyltransferase [candidate division WS1 bacterium]
MEPPDQPAFCQGQISQVLLCPEQIAARVAELGEQITRDYAGRELTVMGVMNGACVFLSDLLRHLDLPIRVDFVAVHSYGSGTKSSGQLEMVKGPTCPLCGEQVLLVEDIIDTGWTISWLRQQLEKQGAEVRICSLLDKPERRETQVQVEYLGFEVPNVFVVGYGIDFAHHYRNLPYVAVLKPEAYEVEKS